MAKRIKKRKSASQNHDRQTNWVVLGGILGVGIIALFGLLFFTLQNSGASTSATASGYTLALQEHCANNPDNCVVNGSEDAPVTVVEVSDYGCGHCKNFNLDSASTLKEQFVDTGIVRWITVPPLQMQPSAPQNKAHLMNSTKHFLKYKGLIPSIPGLDLSPSPTTWAWMLRRSRLVWKTAVITIPSSKTFKSPPKPASTAPPPSSSTENW